VWLFTEGRVSIRCACLFDWRDNAHSEGTELLALQFPSYFEEIERGRIVAAENAPLDPRTREFRDGYLDPLGITSMLDVPLKHRDHLAGVLCFEHTGPHRPWLPEEQQFAAFASSLVTLAMEVSQRMG
jgi:GAF domain-containing protein